MSDLERLITFLTAQYRWGLHPLKVLAALLLPMALFWIADWQVRRLGRDLGRDIGDREPSHGLAAGEPPAAGRG